MNWCSCWEEANKDKIGKCLNQLRFHEQQYKWFGKVQPLFQSWQFSCDFPQCHNTLKYKTYTYVKIHGILLVAKELKNQKEISALQEGLFKTSSLSSLLHIRLSNIFKGAIYFISSIYIQTNYLFALGKCSQKKNLRKFFMSFSDCLVSEFGVQSVFLGSSDLKFSQDTPMDNLLSNEIARFPCHIFATVSTKYI